MQIKFLNQDRTLVVVLEGEIDHHTTVEIRQRVDREFEKTRSKNLLFDFDKIRFMDSSGIGMLMGRYRNVAICGGAIGLFNVDTKVNEILSLSGIYKLMKVYTTKEEALSALA